MTRKAFKKLPKDKKRVAIAKDVLVQLNARKIIPVTGTYLSILFAKESDKGKELQSVLKKKECEACALGSCFISLVRFEDNFKVKDKYIDEGEIYKSSFNSRLKKYFSATQLVLIESAFEKTDMASGLNYNMQKMNDAIAFGRDYYYPSDRLVAIMRNIIENSGTFIPPTIQK